MTGTDAGPAGVDPDSPPDWTTVGTDGTVSWHDHRTHWMGGDPPALGPDGLIQEWSLPLTVDGAEVTVNGTLSFVDDVFPWGVVVAIAVAVGVWLRVAPRHHTTGPRRPGRDRPGRNRGARPLAGRAVGRPARCPTDDDSAHPRPRRARGGRRLTGPTGVAHDGAPGRSGAAGRLGRRAAHGVVEAPASNGGSGLGRPRWNRAGGRRRIRSRGLTPPASCRPAGRTSTRPAWRAHRNPRNHRFPCASLASS